MLTLVTLFLVTLVVATAVIWVYRLMFGVQNYESGTAGKKRGDGSVRLRSQRGYVSLKHKSEKPARTLKGRPELSPASGKNKVPWGW